MKYVSRFFSSDDGTNLVSIGDVDWNASYRSLGTDGITMDPNDDFESFWPREQCADQVTAHETTGSSY
jgi:hypothetical protein